MPFNIVVFPTKEESVGLVLLCVVFKQVNTNKGKKIIPEKYINGIKMKQLITLVAGCELTSPILDKILRELNFSLPDDVFEFYLRNNSQEYIEKNYSEELKVRGWFCFSTPYCKCEFLNSDFQKTYLHSREFLPDGLVPFAYNYMDDYYLLSLRSIDYGAIYFYRTDMYFEENGAMVLIANNFSQFVNELKE